MKQIAFYKMLTILFVCIVGVLLLTMGLLAYKTSLKLQLQIGSTPSVWCALYVNGSSDPVFDNLNSKIGDGVSLSGSTLSFNSFNTNVGLGENFSLQVENKSQNGALMMIQLSGCTVGENANYTEVISSGQKSSSMAISTTSKMSITIYKVFKITVNMDGVSLASNNFLVHNGTNYVNPLTNLSLQFSANVAYQTPFSITSFTINGSNSTNYQFNASTGVFTCLAQNFVGDVVLGVKAEKMPNLKITTNATASTYASSGVGEISPGASYTTTLTAVAGSEVTAVEVIMAGNVIDSSNYSLTTNSLYVKTLTINAGVIYSDIQINCTVARIQFTFNFKNTNSSSIVNNLQTKTAYYGDAVSFESATLNRTFASSLGSVTGVSSGGYSFAIDNVTNISGLGIGKKAVFSLTDWTKVTAKTIAINYSGLFT